ncbi:MAG: hypothetical protein P8I03_09705 [Thalassotalea sp.]|nr:hypothetical protein [Thalassotalea sp.]
MKNLWMVTALSLMGLFSCGGSEEGSDTGTSSSAAKTILSNTYWEKECSVYNKFSSDELKDAWNVKIALTIDSSLKATYRTEYFHPTDTECDLMMFDALDISTFDIRGEVTTDEGIKVNGLNENYTYNSDSRDLPPNYTLIYIASEKLYFGQKSAENHGETLETRHSSISLDNYFRQIIE